MAAPFPPEGVSGSVTDPAESEARNLYAHFVWAARLAEEMNAEAQLDLKRAIQLVLHCRKYRDWMDALQARITAGTHTNAQIAALVSAVFAVRKVTWGTTAAMNADLQAIYTAAGTLADWIETNAPEYKAGFSTNKEVSFGVWTDEPIKIAKPAALATRLTDFRALWS